MSNSADTKDSAPLSSPPVDETAFLPLAANDGGKSTTNASAKKMDGAGRGSDDAAAAAFGTNSVTSYDKHAAEVLDEAAVEAAGQESGTSLYIWTLTAISAVSGALFGYDTGAINSVLVQVGTDIDGRPMTDGEKELITSGLAVGAIVGSILIGYLSDRLGRKRSLVFCDALFIAGAVVQAAISSKWPFIVGRFIMGIGVGAASQLAPVFISEISPVNVRGRLVTLNVVAITFGQVLATAIGAGFANVAAGWRWTIAIGAIAPLIQGVVIEVFFPESPRHLIKTGKADAAAKVLAKMYPRASEDQLQAKVDVLQRRIASDTKTAWTKYKDLVTVGQLSRASILAALLQVAQQLSGFNALMYYSATIFSLAGLKNSTATSLVVSGVNFVVTCIAVLFLDRFGRRNFLKVTIPIMIFGLLFSTVVFYYMTAPTDHYLRDGFEYDKKLSSVMIFSMVIFVAGYAGGLGHVPWSAGDFFDQDHRGVGASVGAFANWSMNLVVSSTFLLLLKSITPAGTFGFYAGLSTLLAAIIYFTYPETLGLPLEQACSTVDGGFHVKRSEMLRKQNVRMLRERKLGGGAGASA
ncbi:putative ITR2-myo-inositol transporter [Jaminaea rosea]|uniref:Putative ITR2-myo-inositol transporter n=1 Tax=Jaminaea rosea TaxID=1569628 RepID=A0A316UN49_9BASI|nr:putative ITR2-myo-inositol transporter [Jaminaea rosea]PWN26699.1 putative ITR2-myo-inositol transporter [Jaminaea rosea]